MLAKLFSVTLEGIDGILCEVEVDVSRSGFERPTIVGLPDTAVKESASAFTARLSIPVFATRIPRPSSI